MTLPNCQSSPLTGCPPFRNPWHQLKPANLCSFDRVSWGESLRRSTREMWLGPWRFLAGVRRCPWILWRVFCRIWVKRSRGCRDWLLWIAFCSKWRKVGCGLQSLLSFSIWVALRKSPICLFENHIFDWRTPSTNHLWTLVFQPILWIGLPCLRQVCVASDTQ